MKSVAAGNPKLVHGSDRLKEIAERIKRKGEEGKEEKGKRVLSPLPPLSKMSRRVSGFRLIRTSQR